MKYAVMSDAHANPEALAAALADARRRRCERFVLLGDVTGYGYDVEETARIVRENFDVVLMGNHDSACAGFEPWMDVQTNRNYRLDVLQRSQLAEEAMEWLRTLPHLHSERDAAFVHGDFTSPPSWNYVFSPQDAAMSIAERDEHVLFCGHTHHAVAWELNPSGVMRLRHSCPRGELPGGVVSKTIALKADCRYVVNVGSVGYPRYDPCSTYAIYDDVSRRVVFRHLPFDFHAYAIRMTEHGVSIPFWLSDILG